MSSTTAQVAASQSMQENKTRAQGLYGIAIPAMQQRMGTINTALAGGEPAYMRSAFAGQRGALAEGISQQGSMGAAQQAMGAKSALSGGNAFSTMHPADIGAQLANALYGSKFAEGQANIDQTMNLMGMALGGAGQAGSASMTAAGQQLQSIGMLPNYNQTYANVMGGLAGGASIYGALNKYGLFDPGPMGSLGGTPPTPFATNYPPSFVGGAGGPG